MVLFRIYKDNKGKNTYSNKDFKELTIMLEGFTLQKGTAIVTPVSFMVNFSDVGRILVMFAMRRYENYFAYVFLLYNVIVVAYLVN